MKTQQNVILSWWTREKLCLLTHLYYKALWEQIVHGNTNASLTNNEQTLVHPVMAKISTDELLHCIYFPPAVLKTLFIPQLCLLQPWWCSTVRKLEQKRKERFGGHRGRGSNLQRHYKNVNNKCHLKRPLGLSHLHKEKLGHARSCWNNPLGTMNWSQWHCCHRSWLQFLLFMDGCSHVPPLFCRLLKQGEKRELSVAFFTCRTWSIGMSSLKSRGNFGFNWSVN